MKALFIRFVDSIMQLISNMLPPRIMRHWCFLLSKADSAPDSWGYHIRPIHYYEPLPDFRTVTASMCDRRREPPGIDFALPKQIEMLKTLAVGARAELDAIVQEGAFDFTNMWFSGLDACAYYALIRYLKPRRIIEVGSGYSTRIASLAVARNEAEGSAGGIICIEPYPEQRLIESSARFTLIEKPVQEVPLRFFEELSKNDILMIDSSHVAKIGGDVCYEFLDILPRLKPEVWVHVHDIFFPQDYSGKFVINERRAYNEQYVLEAFLSGNKSFAPKLANHWLVLDHRSAVDALCPPGAMSGLAVEQLGVSFWMCRSQ